MVKKATKAARGRVVSMMDAAHLIGRHRNTLMKWLSEGAPAVAQPGDGGGPEWQIDLGALLDWYAARKVAEERGRLEARHAAETERLRQALEAADSDPSPGPISRSEALRRRAVAEMRLKEIELEERDGRLIPIAAMTRIIVTLFHGVKAWLLGIPSKIAVELAAETNPRECHRIVEDALHEAMRQIADGEAAGLAVEQILAEASAGR